MTAIAAVLLLAGCGKPKGSSSIAEGAAGAGRGLALAEFRAADAAFARASDPCVTLPLVPRRSHDPARFHDELARARDACRLAATTARSRPFGRAVPEPARSRLNAALAVCALAYAGKAEAFGAMMQVADGDGRPASVALAARSMVAAHRDVPACGERYAAAVASRRW